MAGKELLEELTKNTGLPEEPVLKELNDILARAGLTPESLDIDSLRDVLAEYLQEILIESQNTYSK